MSTCPDCQLKGKCGEQQEESGVSVSIVIKIYLKDGYFLFYLIQACHITLFKKSDSFFGDFGKMCYSFLLCFSHHSFFTLFLPIKVKSIQKSKAVTNNVCETSCIWS